MITISKTIPSRSIHCKQSWVFSSKWDGSGVYYNQINHSWKRSSSRPIPVGSW